MTFIQPNKSENSIYLMIILGAILILAVFFYVYLYSGAVSLKHDMAKLGEELEGLKVENAELKNEFYSLIDSRRLEELAEEKNLVYEKNPQWAFVSQF